MIDDCHCHSLMVLRLRNQKIEDYLWDLGESPQGGANHGFSYFFCWFWILVLIAGVLFFLYLHGAFFHCESVGEGFVSKE